MRPVVPASELGYWWPPAAGKAGDACGGEHGYACGGEYGNPYGDEYGNPYGDEYGNECCEGATSVTWWRTGKRRGRRGRQEDHLGERARQLSAEGDREGALHLWRELARRGDVEAAATLVVECSAEGLYDEALLWWRRAVEGGASVPAHDPGVRLRTMGREPSAEGWWRKAAEAEDDDASREHLGSALRARGRADEAEEWLLPGARRGHGGCARELAEVYRRRAEQAAGEQSRQAHAARAVNWAQRAAMAGDARARVLLLRMAR